MRTSYLRRRPSSCRRLRLEQLENRSVLSTYSMTDLGTLGGAIAYRLGHQRGRPGGRVLESTAAGQQHAFLWEDGVMTDLGTLGGAIARRAA